jgi:hypothetical protein
MNAFDGVRATIATYFDGLYECDIDKLDRVFHSRALYATADEAPPLYCNMDDYFAIVTARQSPASRNEARRDHIDEIQVAGDNTAFARVRCSIGARDFVDFLSFVQEDGRWQIIAKVFQIIER